MSFLDFDGFELQNMLVGAVNRLGENKEEIDSLNVFPVPDGDTGTNMYLTLLAGVKASQEAASGRAREILVFEMGPVVGTHAGPGLVGLVCHPGG